MLKNLKTLNDWTFSGLSLESPFTDEVREVWGTYNEANLYQSYLAFGEPEWQIINDAFKFKNRTFPQSRHLEVPFSLPAQTRDEFQGKSAYLKLLSESVANSSPSDVDIAWKIVYEQHPEMEQKVIEELKNEEKNVSKQLNKELTSQLFTPTEKYLARLGLSTFFSVSHDNILLTELIF